MFISRKPIVQCSFSCKRTLLSLVALFLSISYVNATSIPQKKKESKSTRILKEYSQKADSLADKGLFNEALSCIKEAYVSVKKPQKCGPAYYYLRNIEGLLYLYIDNPDYEKAIEAMEDVIHNSKEYRDKLYPELSRAYMVLGQYERAIHYLELSVEYESKQEPVEFYWLMRSQELLATCYKRIGDNESASKTLSSMVEVPYKRLAPEEYLNLFWRAFNDVILDDNRLVNWFDRAALQIILELANSVKDNDPLQYVYLMDDAGNIAQVLGDFQLAFDCTLEAINNYSPEIVWPLNVLYSAAGAAASRLNQFDVAENYFNLASDYITNNLKDDEQKYYLDQLQYSRAILYLDKGVNTETAISIISGFLQNDNLDLNKRAECYYNLGQAYSEFDLNKAEDCYSEALKLYGQSGGHDVFYAKTLSRLGRVALNNREHDNAIKYYELSIDIFRRLSKNDNYSLALALGDAAISAYSIKQYGRAIAWAEESCRLQRGGVGYMYLSIWDILLSAYADINDNENYYRVFEEYEKVSQSSLYEKINCLCKKANQLYSRGEVEEMISTLNTIDSLYLHLPPHYQGLLTEDIIRTKSKLYNEKNDVFAYYTSLLSATDSITAQSKSVLRSIASDCFRNNDYNSANFLTKTAYDTAEKSLGYLEKCLEAAYMSYDSAFEKQIKQDLLTLIKEQFKDVIGLTDDEKEEYWQHIKYIQDCLFAIREDDECDELLFEVLLTTKNFLLRSNDALRKYISNSSQLELKQLGNELRQTKRSLAEGRTVLSPEMIDSLRLREIEINREIVLELNDISFLDFFGGISYPAIVERLNDFDAAVEFIDYLNQDNKHIYGAFLVTKEMNKPLFVKLCTQDDLEQFSHIAPQKLYRKDLPFSRQLYTIIWEPLSHHLEGKSRVFISPSGLLNTLALEAITEPNGEYLRDNKEIVRLSSVSVLCEERAISTMSTATVFGGIDYDATHSENNTETTVYSDLSFTRDRSLNNSIQYLPSTKIEADNITKLLLSGHVQTRELLGKDGTEEEFKALSGTSMDIIHVATHGFYQPEQKASRVGFFDIQNLSTTNGSESILNPLQRSGLLLAGCSEAWKGIISTTSEDGVLTAGEISGLDLSGTKLVVMSACESGLGDVTNDGIAGLQRGFKNAGVERLIMSLWKVDDEATEMLMTQFYSNIIKGESINAAFVSAQDSMKKSKKYNNPYYWASFIILD